MRSGAAARITDNVIHPLPPVLTPGPGSMNVLIGFLPAWRAVPTGAGAALQGMNQVANTAIQVAEAATLAAAGTPGAPAAYTAEQALKASLAASNASAMSAMSGGADTHACLTPLPVPPHGPGFVIDGSPTVQTNNLPQARMGDTLIEAVGPPNKIVRGCMTVIVGDKA